MESGVHSSLHPNSHHQITYAKFNPKIYYPPPYEREIWHYEKAKVDHIRKSIDEFSWERSFANTSLSNKVHMFNKTIKNIMSNYIPHETITCDDRNPPWINKNIKQLTLDKNHAYKSYKSFSLETFLLCCFMMFYCSYNYNFDGVSVKDLVRLWKMFIQ